MSWKIKIQKEIAVHLTESERMKEGTAVHINRTRQYKGPGQRAWCTTRDPTINHPLGGSVTCHHNPLGVVSLSLLEEDWPHKRCIQVCGIEFPGWMHVKNCKGCCAHTSHIGHAQWPSEAYRLLAPTTHPPPRPSSSQGHHHQWVGGLIIVTPSHPTPPRLIT